MIVELLKLLIKQSNNQAIQQSSNLKKTQHIAKFTRLYRRLHRWVAVPLFVFMFIIGLTGVLLGWKKQVEFTPPTQRGTSSDASKWIGFDEVQRIASTYVADSLHADPAIDRIDVRPVKGVAKVKFETHYHEVQIDLTTGEILSVKKRWNDFIEQVHDGTIIDRLLGTNGDPVKTTYTSITSLGLMLLSLSGFFLWLNPKRIRHIKREHTDTEE